MNITFVLSFFLFISLASFSSCYVVGIGSGGISYWSSPMFANAFLQGSWLSVSSSSPWGSNYGPLPSPQFNRNGVPQYLLEGQQLRGIVYSLHVEVSSAPPSWPTRSATSKGVWRLTWQGAGDLQCTWCTFIKGGVSGSSSEDQPETGLLVDGWREYNCTGGGPGFFMVYELNQTLSPLEGIQCWMPDPDSPTTSLWNRLPTLDYSVQPLFYPIYIERLLDRKWSFLRMMDLTCTNNNPQQDWIDRRLPSHVLQKGVINDRCPAEGYTYTAPNQLTCIAYETIVALANKIDTPMWINVPHLATDDFVTQLAQLILYGSDGEFPYTETQLNPLYPPLNSNLEVIVEYSNEIWSNGASFQQGSWAAMQSASLNISQAVFNARRFCDIFSIFKSVFSEQSSRLINCAAIWSASTSYIPSFLDEMESYCPTLSPPTKPDFISPTTYFGNGIQDYVWNKGWWNHDTDSPYWESEQFELEKSLAFDEWTMRQLSEAADTGAGPDANSGMTRNIRMTYEYGQQFSLGPLPVISYEGGPSIYTDRMDDGSGNTSGITFFMDGMNRDPQMDMQYGIALNMALANGLVTHGAFVDVGRWGKHGQWGHLEYIDQDPQEAVKWNCLLNFYDTFEYLSQDGTKPTFTTDQFLPPAQYGEEYIQDIVTSNAAIIHKLASTANINEITLLDPCPSFPGQGRLYGVPINGTGTAFLYLRVDDSTKEHSGWQVFTIAIHGDPFCVIEADFDGVNPGLSLPWNATYPSVGEEQGFASWGSGLHAGDGVITKSGDNRVVFSVVATEDSTTFEDAIDNDQYLSFSIEAFSDIDLRSGFIEFKIQRIEYLSARKYALLSSVSGFTSTSEPLGETSINKYALTTFTVRLPSSDDYLLSSSITIEFRLYCYEAKYNHDTSVSELSVRTNVVLVPTDPTTALSPQEAWQNWCPQSISSASNSQQLLFHCITLSFFLSLLL